MAGRTCGTVNHSEPTFMKSRPTCFEPAGFFMLRRPLLPLETLYDFNEKTCGHQKLFEQQLVRLLSQPLLAEAVYLASPSLYTALFEPSNKAEIEPGALRSLYKYLIRVCSRATPFGLFSGFSTGTFSESTQISFKRGDALARYQRLHMAAASELVSRLMATPEISQEMPLYVNSSLYTLGDEYRFVERAIGPQGHSHILSAVKRDPLLDLVIGFCRNGCVFKILIGSLCDQISNEQATAYINGLISMQILVSGLEVNVTGQPYLERIEQHLAEVKPASKQVRLLKEIRKLLLAPEPLTVTVPRLRHLPEAESITAGVAMPVQIDLRFKTLHCSLSREWISTLAKEFEQISVLFEFSQSDSDLERFKKAFVDRYQEQEIPLLEALDAESGIGYGAVVPGSSDQIPLLDSIKFPPFQPAQKRRATAFTDLKEQLQSRALNGGACSIELSVKDLEPLKELRGHPGYFYWLGSILTANAGQLDQGNFRFLLRAVGGSSGLELLGRFCHADPVLSGLVQASASQQQQKTDAVLAEIAHLPAASAAAILSRPHLTDYEIVYLAASSRPVEKRILASDLMVSVRNGKQLVLRSKRLDKQVIPVLNSAHNFSDGLPAYRFLCELARERQQFGSWDWGDLGTLEFLPRLTYKHLVISRATWNLTRRDFPHLSPGREEFMSLWEPVRRRLQIPRYFQICRHDQELLVDSQNCFSLELLKEVIYKKGKARIVEVLQEPDEGLVIEEGKHFAHEIVIPFRPLAPEESPLVNIRLAQVEQRRFMTASSWLFVKIYVGTGTADRVLTDLIGPYCQEMLALGKLEKWFFIRYQDPEPHLRLRFYHGDRTDFWQHILADLHRLLSGWIESRLVLKVQTDTYTRELERYQGLKFERVESIFYADSQAVIKVIREVSGYKQPDVERWLAALFGADVLLGDLGLNLDEKLGLVSELCMHLTQEFAAGMDLKIQLDRQYRSRKDIINTYMKQSQTEICKIFSERSALVKQILESERVGIRPPVKVAASFVHMFFNRIFGSAPRQQELVMYHYLNKYYKALSKRAKNIHTV